jgi:hypothetical protein
MEPGFLAKFMAPPVATGGVFRELPTVADCNLPLFTQEPASRPFAVGEHDE